MSVCLILLAGGIAFSANAQEPKEVEYFNNVAVFLGGSTEFADERESAALIGLEYERRFNSYWGATGFVEASSGDFKRSHMFGAGATLRPTGRQFRVAFLIAAEYLDSEEGATEEELNDGPEVLFRTSLTYEFEFGRFTVEPGIAIDLGGETDTITNYGFVFGYNF